MIFKFCFVNTPIFLHFSISFTYCSNYSNLFAWKQNCCPLKYVCFVQGYQIFLSKVFKIRIVTLLKLVSAIFYQILFFPQMIALQKLWTMFFILSKKLFLFSRYSNFWIFSFPFHNFQTQKDKWKWNNLWCHELACINLQM